MKSSDGIRIAPEYNAASFNSIEAAKRQGAYCNSHDLPYFAPFDGTCWYCGHNIYGPPFGFTVYEASRTLITYCPYCDRSFAD